MRKRMVAVIVLALTFAASLVVVAALQIRVGPGPTWPPPPPKPGTVIDDTVGEVPTMPELTEEEKERFMRIIMSNDSVRRILDKGNWAILEGRIGVWTEGFEKIGAFAYFKFDSAVWVEGTFNMPSAVPYTAGLWVGGLHVFVDLRTNSTVGLEPSTAFPITGFPIAAPPGPPPPNPPYIMFLILIILILQFPLITALVIRMMRSEDERRKRGESMEKWKILILTPYIIMLATLLFYALLFGAVELLGLVIDGGGVAQTKVWFKQIIMFAFLIFQAAVGIEIPFIPIYTIILEIALTVRWIIVRRRKDRR
ncbi:MAG: hypothetical protein ACETWE_03265 [Candidatus Bathyarchaeia archaeon]